MQRQGSRVITTKPEGSSKLVYYAPAHATDCSTHGEVNKMAMRQPRALRTDPPPSQEFEVRPLGTPVPPDVAHLGKPTLEH